MKNRYYFLIIVILTVALIVTGCTQAPRSAPVTGSQTTARAVASSMTTPIPNGPIVTPARITTSKDLITFVRQAVNYARENGRDKAVATFNDPKGPFVTGNLYIFAESYNGTALAEPFEHDIEDQIS
jgi:cytochrome c